MPFMTDFYSHLRSKLARFDTDPIARLSLLPKLLCCFKASTRTSLCFTVRDTHHRNKGGRLARYFLLGAFITTVAQLLAFSVSRSSSGRLQFHFWVSPGGGFQFRDDGRKSLVLRKWRFTVSFRFHLFEVPFLSISIITYSWARGSAVYNSEEYACTGDLI